MYHQKTLNFFIDKMIKVDLEAFYRKTQKDAFTQILKIKNIDACKLLSDMDSYSMLRDHINYLNESTHGSIHKCPYKSLSIVNHTTSFEKTVGKTSRTSLSPNGIIRFQVNFRNRKKLLGCLNWTFIQNFL